MKPKVGWAEAIQRAFSDQAEVVPPGWQTLEEVAAELRQNKWHVCRRLNQLIRLGMAETKKFKTLTKGGADDRGQRRSYIRLNRHYRLKKTP